MPVSREAGGAVTSERLAQSQVDAAAAGERVVSIGERRDAVVGEPRGAAPHCDVAAIQAHAAQPIAAARAAEQEHRRQPQRYGYDRSAEVALVSVLVEREPRPRF